MPARPVRFLLSKEVAMQKQDGAHSSNLVFPLRPMIWRVAIPCGVVERVAEEKDMLQKVRSTRAKPTGMLVALDSGTMPISKSRLVCDIALLLHRCAMTCKCAANLRLDAPADAETARSGWVTRWGGGDKLFGKTLTANILWIEQGWRAPRGQRETLQRCWD